MMKLSNFDWTDKDSIRWFIILPVGHEGPYSFANLLDLSGKSKISMQTKIWAEGLSNAVQFGYALDQSVPIASEPVEDLPPLPIEADLLEDNLIEDESPPEIPVAVIKSHSKKVPLVLSLFLLIALMTGLRLYIKNQEVFEIHRVAKMSPAQFKKIKTENSFDGWGKKLFFREYLPADNSLIWLVSSSFHQCEVEAVFNSVEDKLLTLNDDKVSFSSSGRLSGHLVTFSEFSFLAGTKIVPGLYEMEVKATKCEWDSFLSKLMNRFKAPEKEYFATTKVVLFSKGAVEFNKILDEVVRKKLLEQEKKLQEEMAFWQDLLQKLQTLEAICLQVEQSFLDLLEVSPSGFKPRLKVTVSDYTKRHGTFLTKFVLDNENYFKKIASGGSSQKRHYEVVVRSLAKKIGLESMKFIEDFQKMKKPSKKQLLKLSGKVKKVYAAIKGEVTQKLEQISLEQVN